MKIAFCLYGQLRDYHTGYLNIKNFIENNNEHSYSFFMHAWCADNIKYNVSPWRKFDENILNITNSDKIKKDIIEYYNPICYEFQKSIDNFDLNNIKNTIAYSNSNDIIKNNSNNFLSQIYSRNKVRDLFYNHVKTLNINYDMIITMRFDMTNSISFSLKNINTNKIYVGNAHYPRYLLPDNIIICPQHVYIKWFDIYNNLSNIINNDKLNLLMKHYNEILILNPEQIITANYLYYYFNMDNIEFVSGLNLI